MPLRLVLAGLLLLTALGLGLVGYQATRPPKTVTIIAAAPPPPLNVDVLVAAHGLPAGTLLRDEEVATRAVPSAEVPQGALTNSPEARGSLRGALLRRYLDPSAVLMTGDVLRPRDRGFLAAVLTPGSRAISVGVDAITGDGGLIWPGDKVDMILTQQLDEKDAPLARRFIGETVLRDVRVVAIDQSIAQGAVAGIEGAAGHVAHTVTLEMTAQQAESAAVAERLGRITLAIRAAEWPEDVAAVPSSSVYGSDVSPALTDGGTRMRVIDGKDIREVTFP